MSPPPPNGSHARSLAVAQNATDPGKRGGRDPQGSKRRGARTRAGARRKGDGKKEGK